jgi:cell wall assembly regulator SMI1
MITLENRGPKLAETDIASLEASLGVSLPAEYRNFLRDANGGVPTPDVVDIAEFPGSSTDVQVLFGVRREVETSCIEWNTRTLAQRLGGDFFPIARDSGGNVFCLSLRPLDNGAVLYCDLEACFADFESEPQYYHVAPSFESFLGKLRPLTAP